MLKTSVIIVICLLLLLVVTWKVRECFVSTEMPQPPLYILSQQECIQFLQKDHDDYVKQLTPADLHARGVSSRDDYIDQIVQAAHNVSQHEYEAISNATRVVNTFLTTTSRLGVPSDVLYRIPWKIAVTRGHKYEEGLPHTRHDIIFIDVSLIKLPTLANTLLHEKVHIYQRMYPHEVEEWLSKRNYMRVGKRSSRELTRANPDVDEWIYMDKKTNTEMIALYNSKRPYGISDVTLLNAAFEHPFETMAYEVAASFSANDTISPS